MSEPYTGYHIGASYRSVDFFRFDASHQRISVGHCKPDRGMTRRERYDVLVERFKIEGITPPPYEPGRTYHA